MLDIRINNILIFDGTDTEPFYGSIGVKDSEIMEVGRDPFESWDALKIIDGNGLAATPGFVDTHIHTDAMLFEDDRASSLLQGVTTEIIGQDGLSYAPMSKQNLEEYSRYLEGLNGPIVKNWPDFISVADFLSALKEKVAVNAAYLLPHCALRLETAGFQNRLLNEDEMRKAKTLLQNGLQDGAKGFSTGLSYYPGAFCDTAELIELCKTVRENNGVYVTHLRSVFQHERFDPVEEALEIARKSGVKLHFSHYRTGIASIGRPDLIMEKIDSAISEGLDITLELYPYLFGASYAPLLVPPWASEGGFDAIMERLSNTATRTEISSYIDCEFKTLDGVISYAPEEMCVMGKKFSGIALERGVSKGMAIAELLYSAQLALGFHEIEPECDAETEALFRRDVFELISRPCYMVGSDGIFVGDFLHPRGYGAFSRMIRMAREADFPFKTLVQRITDLPCRRFGLKKRGRLVPGYYADIVVLDHSGATDCATCQSPKLPARGVAHVLVNGQLAVEDGAVTNIYAGKTL